MDEILFIGKFVGTAVLSTWPAFVISIVLSVLVRALKLDGAIKRAFQANVGVAIVLATLVGAFSPFCSCTVIPIVAGLLVSGVPLAPVMAFWIASPTMDPEIFALSVGILGWPLALARLAATLVLSVGAGYVTLALTNRFGLTDILANKKTAVPIPESALRAVQTPVFPVLAASAVPLTMVTASPTAVMAAPATATFPLEKADAGGCSSGSCQVRPSTKAVSWQFQIAESFRQINWKEFGRDALQLSWSLGRWLLLAFVMEALITRYIPQAAIASLLGADSWFAVPLAALVGIPLYLNNLAALPIVAGLLGQGMQSGAAIAFLIAGPVTTVPAMTAVWGVVSRRVFVLYMALGLGGAILMGLIINFIGL